MLSKRDGLPFHCPVVLPAHSSDTFVATKWALLWFDANFRLLLFCAHLQESQGNKEIHRREPLSSIMAFLSLLFSSTLSPCHSTLMALIQDSPEHLIIGHGTWTWFVGWFNIYLVRCIAMCAIPWICIDTHLNRQPTTKPRERWPGSMVCHFDPDAIHATHLPVPSAVSFWRTSPCHFVRRNLRHISYDSCWHHLSSRGPWELGRLDANMSICELATTFWAQSSTCQPPHKAILPFCDDEIFHLVSFSDVELLGVFTVHSYLFIFYCIPFYSSANSS